MDVEEWTDKLTAHLRGLEDVECPECQGYDASLRSNGITEYQGRTLCQRCSEDGTIPHPHKAALRVVARECPGRQGIPQYEDGWLVSHRCGICDFVTEAPIEEHPGPRDVSWLEEPQYEPMLRGYYESIARACGRGLATHKGTGGTWTAVSGLAGHVPSLVSSQTLVKAEGATEAEAMQSCLSRALMEE